MIPVSGAIASRALLPVQIFLIAPSALIAVPIVTPICNPRFSLLCLPQHADWRLVQIFLIVSLNVVGCITMPMFDHTQKNWPGYFAYLLVMGGLLAQLPPTHLLLQWLASAPIML